MERHGRIPALQALCDEAKIEYREPDRLWECHEDAQASDFLKELVGYPQTGSRLAKKKKGARGELMLIGGLTYILRDTETYIILSRYVTAPAYSEKGSRQPDTILVTPEGIGTLESKMWHRTDHDDFASWVERDRKQIGETAAGLDTLVRRCLKREDTGVVPIIYNPPCTLTEDMFPPFGDRKIHVVRTAGEAVRAIMQHGARYSEEELYDVKDAILALPTRAPLRDEPWPEEEGYDFFDFGDYPTPEEIEEFERREAEREKK